MQKLGRKLSQWQQTCEEEEEVEEEEEEEEKQRLFFLASTGHIGMFFQDGLLVPSAVQLIGLSLAAVLAMMAIIA